MSTFSRKITRYCLTMTEGHQFDQWILQGSHDSQSWVTLHVGRQSFLGTTCFNINNNNYYEFYRVRVYNWISTPGVVQVDFYEKINDYTTTTSTFTTTTTYTTTTTITSTTTTESTTTSTATTTFTTTAPILYPLDFVKVEGTAGSYQVTWAESLYADYYEIQLRYNNGDYQVFTNSTGSSYSGSLIPEYADSVQFRVRYRTTTARSSSWTESNILILPNVTANFKVVWGDNESEDFLVIPDAGETVRFIDLSTSSHGDIVSWDWTFYTDSKGKSLFNTNSSAKNPTHLYLSKGLFAVKLTVTDETGRSQSVTKERLLEVGCHIDADFQAINSDGVPCHDYIEVLRNSVVNFMDLSNPQTEIVSRKWEFGRYETYGGLPDTSNFLYPSKKYETSGNFNVALTLTGEYGQTSFISKPRFVRVSSQSLPTSTTWTSTTTTVTTTTLTTTTVTTSPPVNWLRISVTSGNPLCSSFKSGNEPYRAFDGMTSSIWTPDISTTTTTATTTFTSTTTLTSTTRDYFLSRSSSDLLWDVGTDLKDFRENFIRLMTPDNVYKVRKVDHLPAFYSFYTGFIIYEISSDKFFVGLSDRWTEINPSYIEHVLTHVNSEDPIVIVSDQPPEQRFPGLVWVKPETTVTTTTVTTTTATTAWIGNEALVGVGNYPQSDSFIEDHESSKAFDGDISTYWESDSLVSESNPSWLGFYWSTPKIIKWYKINSSSIGSPVTWSILASKNGITWVQIDYRYKEEDIGWRWYALDNNTSYQFYRMYIFETSDGQKPRVNSLEMYQSIVTTTSTTESTTTTLPI